VPKITAVFCDVGGVLLTNGLDHGERAALVEKFSLDSKDFEGRHQMLSAAMDDAAWDLDEYLDRTIFYRPQSFRKQEAREFIYSLSQPLPGSLAVIARVAAAGTVFMATLNNESRELKPAPHRNVLASANIFPSSSVRAIWGISKPHAEIYRLALDLSQRQPQECVFIDDRSLNLEGARRLGLHTIQFLNAAQMESDLKTLGLEF